MRPQERQQHTDYKGRVGARTGDKKENTDRGRTSGKQNKKAFSKYIWVWVLD